MKEEIIRNIIKDHNGKLGGLISILQEIQNKYNYLPEKALRLIAAETRFPLTDIYGAATFYKTFSLKPRGRHLLSICTGTACHVRDKSDIVTEFETQLGVKVGNTTVDKEITLETVNCLGACALGPIVVVDGHYFSHVNKPMIAEIISKARVGLDWVDIETDQRIFPVEVSCPNCNHSLIDKSRYIDGYPSIHVTAAFSDKHGWLRLSCLYGSYSVEHEHEIPKDEIVHFFCPHCNAELKAVEACAACGAATVPMMVKGGGNIYICSRRGCKGHMLDLNNDIN